MTKPSTPGEREQIADALERLGHDLAVGNRPSISAAFTLQRAQEILRADHDGSPRESKD